MTTVNITVTNDADFYRVFQYQTADTVPVPIDITGVEMVMMLRRHATDEAAELRLGTDTGEIVLTDAVNGKFSVKITQTVLEKLPLGDYDQSNVMTIGGLKKSLWNGKLTNNAGPSR